ncbi:hypothetical protein ACJ72_08811 [Emergomyces africanus]|uniref:Uncharacterized protein n=1 Tax=Emergomyces africanus TaxID=1955775 RepID=A0A1B7NJR7_9EURO|nr:hypothetical protein ACJ72_08811 [Emergomyces africanus]
MPSEMPPPRQLPPLSNILLSSPASSASYAWSPSPAPMNAHSHLRDILPSIEETPIPRESSVATVGGTDRAKRSGGGPKLTRAEQTILLNICVSKSTLFGSLSIGQFWSSVAEIFQTYINRSYAGLSARRCAEKCVENRKKELLVLTTGKEEGDDYLQAVDEWIKVVDAVARRNDRTVRRKREYERGVEASLLERENLKRRAGEKIEYDSEDEDEIRQIHEQQLLHLHNIVDSSSDSDLLPDSSTPGASSISGISSTAAPSSRRLAKRARRNRDNVGLNDILGSSMKELSQAMVKRLERDEKRDENSEGGWKEGLKELRAELQGELRGINEMLQQLIQNK